MTRLTEQRAAQRAPQSRCPYRVRSLRFVCQLMVCSGVVTSARAARCPADMVDTGTVCVDRYEVSTVDRQTRTPLSPYYPPATLLFERIFDVWQVERLLWGPDWARSMPLPELPALEQERRFEPMAMSQAWSVPQGYLSRELAGRVCAAAGKRLCSREEWVRACRGEAGARFPYGEHYQVGRCNVARPVHPAFLLHGNSSLGHTDPRLNLLVEEERDALLHPTGTTPACVSRWGGDKLFDMVGNLDEWVDQDGGFLGGFYARSTTQGCDARVSSHAPSYYDYSTGTRCCRDLH